MLSILFVPCFITFGESLMHRPLQDDYSTKLIPFLNVVHLMMAWLPLPIPSFCFRTLPGLLVFFFIFWMHTETHVWFFPSLHCCLEMLGNNSEGEDS